MSTQLSHSTVAERARRAADYLDRLSNAVARAAKSGGTAVEQFNSEVQPADGPNGSTLQLIDIISAAQLIDTIAFDMLHVCEWVERRRGPARAAMLQQRTEAVLERFIEWSPPKRRRGPIILPDLFTDARSHASSLRQWANEIEDEQGEGAGPTPRTILSLGNRQYRIGNYTPRVLTPREDTVLQAFLGSGEKVPPLAAMDEPTLRQRSGYGDAPRILRELSKSYDGIFAPAIRMPGSKRAGGYGVSIALVSR